MRACFTSFTLDDMAILNDLSSGSRISFIISHCYFALVFINSCISKTLDNILGRIVCILLLNSRCPLISIFLKPNHVYLIYVHPGAHICVA